MKKLVSRFVLVFVLAAVMLAGLGLDAAKAKSDTTFGISVYHGINGKALGLSKDLPVIASVYKDGTLLANIPLNFKDRFEAELPPGTYTIMVTSVEAGPLPSMTIENAVIPAGVDVRLQAQLSAGKTPTLAVKIK